MALNRPQHDLLSSLDLHAGEGRIPLSRRIFVNRNLKMETLRAIGFDMDHTLVVYKKLELETLAFKATLRKLIEEKRYPREIESLEYDPQLIIRGLVVDKREGNILKTDQYNYVVRVYHGTRLLPKERRKQLYRNERIRLSTDKYMSIDTLFGLPEATLFALLVQYYDRDGRWDDYTRIYDDVRECIDRAHADNTIKREIIAAPERFIYKTDQIAHTLDNFISQGKQLFLLTNSEPYYTQRVMQFLLDGVLKAYPTWRDYFDVVVVSAKKPRFFHDKTEPRALSDDELREARLESTQLPVFEGGGAVGLETLLGHHGDQILYVGDHTFGDILRAKKRSRWRTAMVIEELATEIELEDQLKDAYRELHEAVSARNNLLLQIDRARPRLQQLKNPGVGATPTEFNRPTETPDIVYPAQKLEDQLRGLEEQVERLSVEIHERGIELEERFNRHWGRLFKCGEVNSRFGNQVKDFACIYTSAVSNFLAYPERIYFRSQRELMPHEMNLHS